MTISLDDVRQLRCIRCHGKLRFEPGDSESTRSDARSIDSGVLRCAVGHVYAVRGGIPFLIDPSSMKGMDQLLRPIYDIIAPIHDAGVRLALPVLQFPDPRASRNNYIARLELDGLKHLPRPKILEVGIGTGANVPLLDSGLSMTKDAEIWGVDFSTGMLDEARRRFAHREDRKVRLVLADAHRLPFSPGTFDRVFSVGAVNAYHDQAAALEQMARVAKPGTPIVVVDEELDPRREHLLLHRLLFRALTAHDANPHAPIEAVPDGCRTEVSPVSRFYYCLRFWTPDGEGGMRRGEGRASAAPAEEDWEGVDPEFAEKIGL